MTGLQNLVEDLFPYERHDRAGLRIPLTAARHKDVHEAMVLRKMINALCHHSRRHSGETSIAHIDKYMFLVVTGQHQALSK